MRRRRLTVADVISRAGIENELHILEEMPHALSPGTAAYVRLSAASRLAMADSTGKSNITSSTLKVREPIVVTAERIANFCIEVGETNPLYLDPAAAAAGPHRGIIAPASFVAAFGYADDVFESLPAFARGGLMAD